MNTGPRLVVVGAGIVGAAIARELASQGARVLILDRIAPAAGATGASFGWINVATADSEKYFRLRRAGIEEYRRLEAETGGMPSLRWTTSLTWGLPADRLTAQAQRLTAWGWRARLLEPAEIARLEPACRAPPGPALCCEDEGVIDPLTATVALLDQAGADGAQRNFDCGVREVLCRNGRVAGVKTAGGVIPADGVVLAAGAGTAALCAPLGIPVPLQSSGGLLAYSGRESGGLRTVLSAGGIRVLQESTGRIRAVCDLPTGTRPEPTLQAAGHQLLDRVRLLLSPAFRLEFRRARLGMRVLPADGLPIIGPAPGLEGLYLAVMHSGITLAPVVGRLAAQEILGEGAADLPAEFRPARFR